MSLEHLNTFGFSVLGFKIWIIRDKEHPFYRAGRQHDYDYISQRKSRRQADDDFLLTLLDDIPHEAWARGLGIGDSHGAYNAFIQDRLIRYGTENELERRATRAYRLVRALGWIPWQIRKARKALRGI